MRFLIAAITVINSMNCNLIKVPETVLIRDKSLVNPLVHWVLVEFISLDHEVS